MKSEIRLLGTIIEYERKLLDHSPSSCDRCMAAVVDEASVCEDWVMTNSYWHRAVSRLTNYLTEKLLSDDEGDFSGISRVVDRVTDYANHECDFCGDAKMKWLFGLCEEACDLWEDYQVEAMHFIEPHKVLTHA